MGGWYSEEGQRLERRFVGGDEEEEREREERRLERRRLQVRGLRKERGVRLEGTVEGTKEERRERWMFCGVR